MKKKLFLIKKYGLLSILPVNVGVHKLLKREKIFGAYKYYHLKTGKSLYYSKIFVDGYNAVNFTYKR